VSVCLSVCLSVLSLNAVPGDGPDDVSQEKSKLGLGEIYAEQFLKQSANFDATASKQEKEVTAMIMHFQKVRWNQLCILV
jgi:hypothetical protein